MKREPRVIGIDDSPFVKRQDTSALVVGTIFRGGHFMDGLVSTRITVDGRDATEKLATMINCCKFKPQLRAIFLNGIAVGGFNVINVNVLSTITRLPIIVVVRNAPNYEKIFSALEKLHMDEQLAIIKSLPPPVPMGKIYVQCVNITEEDARCLLTITCTHSFIPEPLRLAHIISSGIVKGVSRGRA